MIQGLAQHANKVKFLLNENSSTIFSGAAIGGTVVTAVLTGRATFKAAKLIAEQQEILDTDEDLGQPIELSKTEKTKLVWKEYLPPVLIGAGTITCIVLAHRVTAKKIAALTVAAGASERAFQEYKDKVVEKLGARRDVEVRDEVAQDRVNANPASGEVLIVGTGDVLCYDMLTGRYFQSTMEDIKRAENSVNYELIHFMSCSLSHFYDEIGLPPTSYTDSVGWNMNNKFEVLFSTVFSTDKRPCIAIDFSRAPIPDYQRNWE